MESVSLAGESLVLHPEKAVYWPRERALLLADLHLGKGAHFRRAGIPVPRQVKSRNFQRLGALLAQFEPTRVLLLGDLFHSSYNHVWNDFQDFMATWPGLDFELVPGNHDILPGELYAASQLVLRPDEYVLGPFLLSHHPLDTAAYDAALYNLCGHVHPAVRLHPTQGKGSLRLACFYFGRRQGILPAFGEFTGLAEVAVEKEDRIYALVEGEVVGLAT